MSVKKKSAGKQARLQRLKRAQELYAELGNWRLVGIEMGVNWRTLYESMRYYAGGRHPQASRIRRDSADYGFYCPHVKPLRIIPDYSTDTVQHSATA